MNQDTFTDYLNKVLGPSSNTNMEDDAMELEEPVPVTPINVTRPEAFNEPPNPPTSKNDSEPDITTTKAISRNEAASIVILDDDDDEDDTVKEIIDLVDKPKTNRCLNTHCKGDNPETIVAPDFCLSYFRVKKCNSKGEEICMDCYMQAVQDNDKLATALKEGNLMFNVDFPVINETFQIDDSDEEEENLEEMDFIDEENFEFISENIDEVLWETLEKLNFKKQMEKEREFLCEEAKKVEDDVSEITTEVNKLRSTLDRIQLDLYNQFRPEIRSLKAITILDDYTYNNQISIRPEESNEQASSKRWKVQTPSLTTPVKNTAPVVPTTSPAPRPSPSKVEIPKDLPVTFSLDKPQPQVDEIFYITRENSQSSWIKARLQQIVPPNTEYMGQIWPYTFYRLVELKQQKERILSGKSIAYMTACKSRLSVGTRVISVFKETILSPEAKRPRSDPYYAGVVAEHPVESNRFRYLIFFDIGYSQYVQHSGINLVLEASKNVWEDMPSDQQSFIKKYLESQDRPMVKLAKDQTVKVEYNGNWWLCVVKEVDCSLVQVYFSQLKRTEWIYRGSTRLSPMFREEMAASSRHTRATRKIALASDSQTVVQYKRTNDPSSVLRPIQNFETQILPGGARAVARKSTTRTGATNIIQGRANNIVPFLPEEVKDSNQLPPHLAGPTSKIMLDEYRRKISERYCVFIIEDFEQEERAKAYKGLVKVNYFTPRDQQVIQREYRPHECSPSCKAYLTHNFTKLRGHNPLSKPLLCGWARLTLKDRGRKEIIYKAPCGRMIRNISEIHYYLRVTESEMTVDLFDFNHMVRCLAEFSVECTPEPKDLSKGLEHVPIPVINGFNNDMLDFCNYSVKRVPMEGVHMNLDPSFLCGCDCDDDCVDKLKCSCWKLTLDGLKYLGKDIDPISVGYIYRRLQEQVITGIYECNSRCKCKSTCLNRVVQNPMSLKLQVFKTHNRGWGIRCLNDIPQGTFICIYAGTIHTEQMANEDGLEFGDEYFAELDYIETVEKFKEDYEEDVVEDEDFREKSPPPEEPSRTIKMVSNSKKNRYSYLEDVDFQPQTPVNVNIAKAADDGYRSRLRKRKEDEDKTIKVKQEPKPRDVQALVEQLGTDIDTVTISDDEDEGREVLSFNPKTKEADNSNSIYKSVRELFGHDEIDNIYIMDAKNAGNIGRFLNHSCSPNVFVQNVFVDTHDVRFPWVAFFSSQFIRAGTELTWNYNYDIGSVPGRVLYCHCASLECKGRLL